MELLASQEPALLFFISRFEYLIAGPKSYQDSRETGPWASKELNDLPEARFQEFPFI